MVCYYYNNSTQSVQNLQALAAAALYKNANKDNFNTCSLFKLGCCCNNGKAGTCSTVKGNAKYACNSAFDGNRCFDC